MADYGSLIASLGAVSHWRTFSGSTLTDVIGGHNGTAAASREPTAGTSPLILQVDSPQIQTYSRTGTEDGFDVTAHTDLRFSNTDSWTMMGVATMTTAGLTQCLCANTLQSGAVTGILIQITPANVLRAYLINNFGGDNLLNVVSTGPSGSGDSDNKYKFKAGIPKHWAVTYDGSSTAAGVKIWLDGVQQATTNGGTTLSATTDAGAAVPFTIGYRGTGISGQGFVGDLGEVAVFRTALTDEQIVSAYKEAFPFQTALGSTWMGTRPKVIVDTDFDSDIDDALDVTYMMRAHIAGKIEIIGIAVTSNNTDAAAAVRAMAIYWGLDGDFPIYQIQATVTGIGSGSAFTGPILSTHPLPGNPDTRTEFPDVADINTLLAAQSDASVCWYTMGTADSFATCLTANAALVNQKVALAISVAGQAPVGSGISDMSNNDAWDTCLVGSNRYQGDWIFVPIWTANNTATGSGIIANCEASNPLLTAWNAYGPVASRPSWCSPSTQYLHFHGEPADAMLTNRGTLVRTTGTGAVTWTSSTSAGKHWILVSRSNTNLSAQVDLVVNGNFGDTFPGDATGGSNYTTPVQGPYFSPGFSPLNPIISIAGG